MTVVGSVLGSNAVGKLIARVESENLWDMKGDGGDDDVWISGWVPTLSGLYLRVLMVFLTKSMASDCDLLDFQLPAIMRLFLAKQ